MNNNKKFLFHEKINENEYYKFIKKYIAEEKQGLMKNLELFLKMFTFIKNEDDRTIENKSVQDNINKMFDTIKEISNKNT